MKKFTKVLGIIALVAIIGFSMAACGGDDDSGGGGGGGGTGGGTGGGNGGGGGDNSSATNGRLTITGLSGCDGKYAGASADDPKLWAAASLPDGMNITGERITNGSVTLKVWKVNEIAYKFDDYSGNAQNVEFGVVIGPSAAVLDGLANPSGSGSGKVTVNFTNGKATGTITKLSLVP